MIRDEINSLLVNLKNKFAKRYRTEFTLNDDCGFRFTIFHMDKKVKFWHSGTFDKPDLLNLVFVLNGNEYLIIFSECENAFFVKNIKHSIKLIEDFFENRFRVIKKRRFLLSKVEYLQFESSGIYTTALKIKTHSGLDSCDNGNHNYERI